MAKTKTKAMLVGAVATAGLLAGAWSLWGTLVDDDGAQSAKLLKNHIWINRLPQGERDMVSFFVALDHRDGKVGAVGKASNWRQLADGLLWKLDGNKLSLYFGQDEVQWQPKAKAWRCEDNAPEGFELCLKIWDENHEVLLYSRDEWELDPDNDHAEVEAFPWVTHVLHHERDVTEDELADYAILENPPL